MLDFRVYLFLLATAFLAWVSRASITNRKLHGFYRFFAWEAIVTLVLVNLPAWFVDPFSPLQLGSWLLLAASIVLVWLAFSHLHRAGAPGAARTDAGLLGLEKTTRLVTSGVYRYIRHPMYSSLLCLAGGAFLKAPGWTAGGLCAAAFALLWMTARIEEQENLRFWGEAYQAYMCQTRRFIPWVF